MNNSAAHTALVAAILAACGSRPDCRLWQNNTGVARGLTGDGIVRFGLKGSADIIGIGSRNTYPTLHNFMDKKPVKQCTFLTIEIKTGRAVQSKHQLAFQKMIEKFGGHYLVARDVESVVMWLDGLLLTRS